MDAHLPPPLPHWTNPHQEVATKTQSKKVEWEQALMWLVIAGAVIAGLTFWQQSPSKYVQKAQELQQTASEGSDGNRLATLQEEVVKLKAELTHAKAEDDPQHQRFVANWVANTKQAVAMYPAAGVADTDLAIKAKEYQDRAESSHDPLYNSELSGYYFILAAAQELGIDTADTYKLANKSKEPTQAEVEKESRALWFEFMNLAQALYPSIMVESSEMFVKTRARYQKETAEGNLEVQRPVAALIFAEWTAAEIGLDPASIRGSTSRRADLLGRELQWEQRNDRLAFLTQQADQDRRDAAAIKKQAAQDLAAAKELAQQAADYKAGAEAQASAPAFNPAQINDHLITNPYYQQARRGNNADTTGPTPEEIRALSTLSDINRQLRDINMRPSWRK